MGFCNSLNWNVVFLEELYVTKEKTPVNNNSWH